MWYREIQEYDLISDYKDIIFKIGQWLHLSFGWPFLDAREVSDTFVDDIMAEQPSGKNVEQFTDYLTDNYIVEDSIFLRMMNASPMTISERTTNVCESFRSWLNDIFPNHIKTSFIFLN